MADPEWSGIQKTDTDLVLDSLLSYSELESPEFSIHDQNIMPQHRPEISQSAACGSELPGVFVKR